MHALRSVILAHLLIILGSMVVGCQDSIKTVTQWYDIKHTKKQAILSVKSSDTTIKEGLCTYYYITGHIQAIQNFVDGKLEGEVRLYYPNGQLRERNIVHNNMRDGWTVEYFMNGQLHDSILFQQGGLWAIQCMYDSIGQPQDYGKIKDGNGVVRLTFVGSTDWYVGIVENGRKNGKWITISADGRERDGGMYEDGYYVSPSGEKDPRPEAW